MTLPSFAVLRPYLWGAAVVAVCGGVAGFAAYERSVGALTAEIASLRGTIGRQAVLIASDSVILVQHDTVKVFKQVTKSDTVLQHIIDSAIVLHHDTVWVTREVLVEAKAAIDSTKKVADACCQLARDYRARNLSLDSLNTRLAKLIPSAATPWLDRAEGAGFCALAVWGAGKLRN